MQRLDYATQVTTADGLSDAELRRLYAHPPAGPADPTPGVPGHWMRLNFVSSIDGAATEGGVSGGLATPGDRRVFTALRELADVVVVGAGTVRVEGYRGARPDADARARRADAGLAEVPPIAVVTRSADLDPQCPLFTETTVPPLVLTCAAADPTRLERLRGAGARILELGQTTVAVERIGPALAELGLSRVLCEGGPGLFGQLIAADLVDELCLTTTPLLVGGRAPRISADAIARTLPMRVGHLLADEDGAVYARWMRDRGQR